MIEHLSNCHGEWALAGALFSSVPILRAFWNRWFTLVEDDEDNR